MTITPIKASKPKAKAISKSVRAGLVLSPAYVAGRIRRFGGVRLAKGGDVYLAAAAEYIVREVARRAMIQTLKEKALRIAPKHITDALHDDEELAANLSRGIVPRGRTYAKSQRVVWSDRKLSSK